MPFSEIQDGGHVLCTVSKFKVFPSRFAFENVGNRTNTDLKVFVNVNFIVQLHNNLVIMLQVFVPSLLNPI